MDKYHQTKQHVGKLPYMQLDLKSSELSPVLGRKKTQLAREEVLGQQVAEAHALHLNVISLDISLQTHHKGLCSCVKSNMRGHTAVWSVD